MSPIPSAPAPTAPSAPASSAAVAATGGAAGGWRARLMDPTRSCCVDTCDSLVASASAEMCTRHALGITDTYGCRSAAAFEARVRTEREKAQRTARLSRGKGTPAQQAAGFSRSPRSSARGD